MKKLFKKYKEVIMYLVFGVLTTIVSLLIYYLLTLTFLNPNVSWQLQIANILSWIGSVTFAYITNRIYVFNSKEKNKLKEGLMFFAARLTTLLLDMLIMYVGVTSLGFNDKIIKIISQILVIIINYVLSKVIVFRKTKKEH